TATATTSPPRFPASHTRPAAVPSASPVSCSTRVNTIGIVGNSTAPITGNATAPTPVPGATASARQHSPVITSAPTHTGSSMRRRLATTGSTAQPATPATTVPSRITLAVGPDTPAGSSNACVNVLRLTN